MTTVTISTTDNVPNGTYFRTGDAEPTIDQATRTITILDGEGDRRGWGAPHVNSRVVYANDDFVSVHVGYSHKHGGGQFWRHYSVNGDIKPIQWRSLDDSLRADILDAYEAKAPHWAKAPGKLRSQYATPNRVQMTTYKAVNAADMTSLYDGRTEYIIGKRLVEAVGSRAGENEWGDVTHDGGWYSHPSAKAVSDLLAAGNLVPARCLDGVEAVAIIKCEIAGRVVRFPNGKIASTYLTPVEVVEVINL